MEVAAILESSVYYLALLTLTGTGIALTGILKFQGSRTAFARPRLEALIAIAAAMTPFILLFAILLLSPNSMGKGTGRPIHDLNAVKTLAVNYSIFLLPMFLLLLLRRQGLASVGWGCHNLGGALVVGILLSLVLVSFFLLKSGTSILSLLNEQYWYAFCADAIIGLGEETLFRGYLQTRV